MPDKTLYVLAQQLRKAALWKRLADDELFAISVPGGVCYCSVMGMMGDFFALAVYPGDEGLAAYRRITGPMVFRSMLARQELMVSQDCIMCAFEAKAELSAQDAAELAATGLSFYGKNAFPTFRRYRPGHYPWYVEDKEEEAMMATALRAALEVSRRLGTGTGQQVHLLDGQEDAPLGFNGGEPFDRAVPLLTERADGGFDWGTLDLPAPVEAVYPSPALTDELLMARIKKAPWTVEWACGASLSPSPVAEGEADSTGSIESPVAAPYFPSLLLAVKQDDGFVICTAMAKGDAPGELVDALVQAMQAHGKPTKILVPDARTHALLSTAMAQLGIPLAWEEHLPILEEVEDSLYESITGREAKDPDEEELSDMLDMVAAITADGDMPGEIRAQLQAMYDAQELPAPLREKLAAILGIAAQRPPKIVPLSQAARGSLVLSVSLGKGCYRHIQLGTGETMQTLHRAILDAFSFDDDHLYAFFMDNRTWSWDFIASPMYEDAERTADQYALESLGLRPGDAFKYVFDFGEEWLFQCKVLRRLEEETEAPRVVRSVGDAPEQYPAWE